MIVDYTPPMTEDVTVDFYLTFATQEEADAILDGLEGYSIDIIGEIEKYPGQYLVNLRGPQTDAWDAYKATPDPTIPYRIWA